MLTAGASRDAARIFVPLAGPENAFAAILTTSQIAAGTA
jgi:hypothetical protein